MLKRCLITDYINTLVNQPIIYGENDCNILFVKIVDTHCGTNYFEQVYKKYDSIKDGIAKMKQLTGFSTALQCVKQHAEEVTEPDDGDLIVMPRKLGSKTYYSFTVYYSGYCLIEEDGVYRMRPVSHVEYSKIYRIKEH